MQYSNAMVTCMKQLRRRIKLELGQEISLAQKDAVLLMVQSGKRSSSRETLALAEMLSELSGLEKPGKGRSQPHAEQHAPRPDSAKGGPRNRYAGPLRG